MVDSPQHSILDFSSPRRPPSEALRQLSMWQANICSSVQDSWGSLLANPIRIQPGKLEPLQHQHAISQLPDDAVGIYFSVGESLLPAMLVIATRQIHGLVADLLDLPGDQWPQSTPLTAAEDSMLELLFTHFAEAIGDGWPASQPLKCSYLETTAKPQRTRLFPIGSPLFSIRFKLVSRFGEETATCLMLKEETEKLMLEHLGEFEPEDRGIHPSLLELTERVPLRITVELGKVELKMSQASSLAAGDVLILDQFVSRPLIATVEGQAKWAGIPMRIGSRQAFQVTHVLDGASVSNLQSLSTGEE